MKLSAFLPPLLILFGRADLGWSSATNDEDPFATSKGSVRGSNFPAADDADKGGGIIDATDHVGSALTSDHDERSAATANGASRELKFLSGGVDKGSIIDATDHVGSALASDHDEPPSDDDDYDESIPGLTSPAEDDGSYVDVIDHVRPIFASELVGSIRGLRSNDLVLTNMRDNGSAAAAAAARSIRRELETDGLITDDPFATANDYDNDVSIRGLNVLTDADDGHIGSASASASALEHDDPSATADDYDSIRGLNALTDDSDSIRGLNFISPVTVPAIPPSIQPAVSPSQNWWHRITFDSFEEDWGHFTRVDGRNAKKRSDRMCNGLGGKSRGDCGIRITGSHKAEIKMKEKLDLSGYLEVRLRFTFIASSMGGGEGFEVLYSPDNGHSWASLKTLRAKGEQHGHDFVNNEVYDQVVRFKDGKGNPLPLTDKVIVKFSTLPNQGRQDKLFILAVWLEGTTLEGNSAQWERISRDDFKEGWGNYDKDASTGKRSKNGALHIWDDETVVSKTYNLTAYDNARISFQITPAEDWNPTGNIIVEFKSNIIQDWETVTEFTVDEFDDGEKYKLHVDVGANIERSLSDSRNSWIRFRCSDCGDEEDGYVSIDQVVFEGLPQNWDEYEAAPNAAPSVAGSQQNWYVIASESFENSFGNFMRISDSDAGKENVRVNCDDGPSSRRRGNCALRLRDGHKASARLKKDRDVTSFTKLRAQVWFICKNLEKKEGFNVEFSPDSSDTWETMAKFRHDADFFDDYFGEVVNIENDKVYEEIVYFDGSIHLSERANIKLNFQGGDASNDRCYILDVSIEGTDDDVLVSPYIFWGTNWTSISFDDFESGWGSFDRKDGSGRLAKYVHVDDEDENFIPSGDGCLRLHGSDQEESVVFLEVGRDVSGFSDVRLTFMVMLRELELGDSGLMVDFSPDGKRWITVKHIPYGGEFVNKRNRQVGIDFGDMELYLNTNEAKIRFKCLDCGDGYVYIDEVLFEGLPSLWERITFDDFEHGWGSFTRTVDSSYIHAMYVDDGGRESEDDGYVPLGDGALRISYTNETDGAMSSVFLLSDVDVTGFVNLKVSFMFTCRGWGTNAPTREENLANPNPKWVPTPPDEFVLEYSAGIGDGWTVIQNFEGDEYDDCESAYRVAVDFNKHLLLYATTATASIRFRCNNCGADDYVYIDEVLFEGVR